MRRTLVTLWFLIFSFGFIPLASDGAQGFSIELIKVIKFADQSAFYNTPWSFCVTEDGLFLIPDHQDRHIKVFQQEGKYLKLVKKFNPIGFGSNRFNKPGYCFYDKDSGKFGVIDVKMKFVFIFKRSPGEMDFKLVNPGNPIKVDCYDLKLKPGSQGKQLIISGYITDKEKKPYDLYTLNLGDTKQRHFLLLSHEKYHLSYTGYLLKYYGFRMIPMVGIRGFVDVRGDDAYFIWEGKLRIIKINLETKKSTNFGYQTEHYIEPFLSPGLLKAHLDKDYTQVINEKAKMSYVKYIFAAPQYIWVVYAAPRQGHLRMQQYTPEGNFLDDIQIPGNLDQVLWFDKDSDTLYSLSKVGNKEHKISIYKVNNKGNSLNLKK